MRAQSLLRSARLLAALIAAVLAAMAVTKPPTVLAQSSSALLVTSGGTDGVSVADSTSGPVADVEAGRASAGGAGCVGDCNRDGVVRIDEIITGLIVELGGIALEACPTIECGAPLGIFVNCAVQAVNNALSGCPVVSPPMLPPPQLALEVEAVPRVAEQEVVIVARLTHSGGALVSYRYGCTARCRPQFYEPISFELRGVDGGEVVVDYPCGGALLCPESRLGLSPGGRLEQTLSITGTTWSRDETDPPNECRGCREVALPAGRYTAIASFVYAVGDDGWDSTEHRITQQVEFEWPVDAAPSFGRRAPY